MICQADCAWVCAACLIVEVVADYQQSSANVLMVLGAVAIRKQWKAQESCSNKPAKSQN
jgi:hypothetical protein